MEGNWKVVAGTRKCKLMYSALAALLFSESKQKLNQKFVFVLVRRTSTDLNLVVKWPHNPDQFQIRSANQWQNEHTYNGCIWVLPVLPILGSYWPGTCWCTWLVYHWFIWVPLAGLLEPLVLDELSWTFKAGSQWYFCFLPRCWVNIWADGMKLSIFCMKIM